MANFIWYKVLIALRVCPELPFSNIYGIEVFLEVNLEQHIKSRLSWCNSYLNLTDIIWRDVMFSYEPQIQGYTIHHRHSIRPNGERFQNS